LTLIEFVAICQSLAKVARLGNGLAVQGVPTKGTPEVHEKTEAAIYL
jgi:hypothetical protein